MVKINWPFELCEPNAVKVEFAPKPTMSRTPSPLTSPTSLGVSAFDQQILMLSTSPNAAWGLTTTTAQDQIDLLGKYVFPSVLSATDRQYGLGLMEHVTPSQAWGVSAGVPPGVTVALKNGWLPLNGNGDWQVNSIGWINGDNRDYLLAVLTTGNPSEGYGIATIQQISSMVFAAAG